MTYNEFKLRFAIQYIGSAGNPGDCMRRINNAEPIARLAWEALSAPAADAVSVAKPSDWLMQLAKQAGDLGYPYMAQDRTTSHWYGYEMKPELVNGEWIRGGGSERLADPQEQHFSGKCFDVYLMLSENQF